VHVKFQAHLTTHETLKAKESYELLCRDLGIIVQSFLTDNGSAFTSKEFTSQLAKFEQVIRFAGTGAHHHNAIAERNIQTIMAIARTMMLHSAIHWPDVADACLWPMAVQHAVFLHNHMPNQQAGISPHDIFTRG
jgi:transposase InsO family protein